MNTDLYESKVKPRGVIENCCFYCDEETTNKIIINKGKRTEREDYLCQLCILDNNNILKKN